MSIPHAPKRQSRPQSKRALFKTLALGHLVVHGRKPNGKPWDGGFGAVSAPDPYVLIYINGVKVKRTPVHKNQFSVSLNQTWNNLRVGTQVKLVVIDKDLSADDRIGVITFTIGNSSRRARSAAGIKSLGIRVY